MPSGRYFVLRLAYTILSYICVRLWVLSDDLYWWKLYQAYTSRDPAHDVRLSAIMNGFYIAETSPDLPVYSPLLSLLAYTSLLYVMYYVNIIEKH